MATHAPTTGAPTRAPSDYIMDAHCLLSQAGGLCTTLAEAHMGELAMANSFYGIRTLIESAEEAISHADSLIGEKA